MKVAISGDDIGFDSFNLPGRLKKEDMLEIARRMGKMNALARQRFENSWKKLVDNLRRGGKVTVTGKLSQREYRALREAFLGKGYTTRINPKTGKIVHTSADGLRMVREPAPKPNNPRSSTGIQANFQARKSVDEKFDLRNVHFDIDLEQP